MIRLALELVIAPALVGGSTLACRRWSARVGGLLSAFPAVVGPVLLITAQERGAAFTARTAGGTLLGLVALAAFLLVYSRVAVRNGWRVSLLAGWTCAAGVAALVELAGVHAAVATGLIGATVALVSVYRVMPAPSGVGVAPVVGQASGDDIALRVALTALLVAVLAAAVQAVGPLVGGMLTGLPVLASVLAVFTHRRHGAAPLIALLRGMVTGMASFVGFCAVVGLLIVPAGAVAAFAAATFAAVALQAMALRGGWARSVQMQDVSRPGSAEWADLRLSG